MKINDSVYLVTFFPGNSQNIYVEELKLGKKILWKNEEGLPLTEAYELKSNIGTIDVLFDIISKEALLARNSRDVIYAFSKEALEDCKKLLIQNNINFYQKQLEKFRLALNELEAKK